MVRFDGGFGSLVEKSYERCIQVWEDVMFEVALKLE